MPVTYEQDIVKLIHEFLLQAKQELRDGTRAATGKSRDSIVENLTPTGGSVSGASYIYHVFAGRGPGKMPPLQNIIDWCLVRGIPTSRAWIIAKRISEAGTKLYQSGGYNHNVLNDVLAQERIDALTKNISVLYAAKVFSDIKNLVK